MRLVLSTRLLSRRDRALAYIAFMGLPGSVSRAAPLRESDAAIRNRTTLESGMDAESQRHVRMPLAHEWHPLRHISICARSS